jgi:hypothetical protein
MEMILGLGPTTAFLEVTVSDSFSIDWWIDGADLRYRRLLSSTGSHLGTEPVAVPPAEVARHLEETHLSEPVPARG